MSTLAFILIAALTFGVCYLLDRSFTAKFRSKPQHRSGLSVRYHKRCALFGLILCLLGIVALFTGVSGNAVLLIGGFIVLLMGICLIVYYMSFGIFYDEDSFILTTFGRKSEVYQFRDIQGQRLYLIQGGNIVIELYLTNGKSVSLQSVMEGVYPFLDHAFAAWCRQTGRDAANCEFHDPANSLWFPTMEDN